MLAPGTPEHWGQVRHQQNVAAGLPGGVTPAGQPGVPDGVVAHIGDVGSLNPRHVPQVENVDTVRAMHAVDGARVLVWRPGRFQRVFRVPPVPAAEGLELERLQLQFALRAEAVKAVAQAAVALQMAGGVTPDALRDLEQRHHATTRQALEAATRAVVLFHTLVRPVARTDRWLWRWLGNPFQNASEGEIAHLLDFFSRCRTG